VRLSFLDLTTEERRLYIEQAAIRRNVSPVVLEKDFWVCWLLGVLFESEFAGSLVFKGGTSLSKAFGVIDRFSEDIDLSLSPTFLKLPAFDYLKRSVKLEFGSLTDQQPTGRHPVRPWIADVLSDAFADWRCDVVALEVERSFWEKATILHAEYHRPSEKPIPDRFSRHYADMAALAMHASAAKALNQHELRDRVVQWKSQFFGSSWANYDLAKPGTFRLVPPAERLPALRRDYQAMRDMYLSDPTPFDDILATLADLENRINHVGS
jgi:hypothetical protein